MGIPAFEGAIERLETEKIVSGLLRAACAELATLLDAPRTVISRVIGDLIVELSDYDRAGDERPLELFLLADYPLTQAVLEARESRAVVRTDPDADPAEAALLERLGYDSLLMVPLRSRGTDWGLVEIYGDERGFGHDQIELARAVVERIGELLAEVEGAT